MYFFFTEFCGYNKRGLDSFNPSLYPIIANSYQASPQFIDAGPDVQRRVSKIRRHVLPRRIPLRADVDALSCRQYILITPINI